MTTYRTFKKECFEEIVGQGNDMALLELSRSWMGQASIHKYSYHFEWMGRPIIQFPQDIVAIQELIWRIKPDLVIEAGIAHGGSLIMSASILALLDYGDAVEAGEVLDPRNTTRKVLGIDIDIRPQNREAIEQHPMAHRIDMIQGSSVAPSVIQQVHDLAMDHQNVLIILDSNHTHDHVLAELEAYAPLTSPGSYCVVCDTVVEDMPDELWRNRPWGKGDNAKTAVWEYLRLLKDEGRKAVDGSLLAFAIDKTIEDKLLITVAPDGYLERIA